MLHAETPWHHHISPLLKEQRPNPKRGRSISSLGAKDFFAPIACESLGVYGAETLSLLKDLGHRLNQTTVDSLVLCVSD